MTDEPMTDVEFAAFCSRAYRCDARIGTVVLRRAEAERLLARFEAICDGAIAARTRADAAEVALDQARRLVRETVPLPIAPEIVSDMDEEIGELRAMVLRLEAERDAAVARAMPEPRLMRTVEEVEALPAGDYLICSRLNRTRFFCTALAPCDERWEVGARFWPDRTMVGCILSGPLPDLPTPTAGETRHV